MNKENTLFGIVGLLLGLIIGFVFANSVNQQAMVQTMPAGTMKQTSNLPEGHPDINNGGGGGGTTSPNQPMVVPAQQVQAAVEAAKNAPTNFEAQMKAAEINYQAAKFDEAVEFLKKANQLKPEEYEVIVSLGNASFDGGRYEEAEKWYTQALAKKSDDVDVRTDLGLTFLFRTPPNYERGIQEFQRSLQTDPNHAQTLQNLAVAYTKKGDAANAKTTLAKLEAIDATNPVISKLREDIQKLETK